MEDALVDAHCNPLKTPLESTFQPDHYVEYLAKVNETNEVQATEDICNNRGVLLVKTGSRIDRAVADKILQHKLIKPLEEQVALNNQINGDKLAVDFSLLSRRFTDVARINRMLNFEADFKALLHFPAVSSCLCQKVTVLKERLPEHYEAGLFGGWLGALLAREMRMPSDLIRAAFFAGLTRDLGFLHIDPAIVYKKGTLSAEDWRAIMSHVLVADLFLSNLSCVTQEVVTAVAEHHERFDGTGYPTGRSGNRLSILSNIIGLVDTLQALRMKQFSRRGRNLMDARPYLQLNVGKHSEPVYEAMMQILKKSGLQMTGCDRDELAIVAARLQDRLVTLQKVLPVLEKLTRLTHELPSLNKQGRLTTVVATNVLNMIQRSGLDQDELIDWSRGVENDPQESAMEEINEMELLANELIWQLNSVYRTCREFCDEQGATTPVMVHMGTQCKVLGRLLSANDR
jgi:HD-GYP domain-containing protein (c-di-GMP phosphodiesterase class II)